ncbi:Heat shock protein 70 family protein [Actinidia chinensis var. chinensis]|uniref:Heat shock protein 70 family protein n=1 Tax=Actinidia chinensis var. chinensis TaxID=1590841 RepID=A0A2R6P0S3_ACTCC|nr:Heat shock protein 70 family protein [Actinidia chinensis var. chinensis]
MAGKGEGPAIGIDLGTTYSCVGVWRHDRVEIIANDQGNRTTPSYVGFTDTERLIGAAAKNQVAMNYINTVFVLLTISLLMVNISQTVWISTRYYRGSVSGKRKRQICNK